MSAWHQVGRGSEWLASTWPRAWRGLVKPGGKRAPCPPLDLQLGGLQRFGIRSCLRAGTL